MVFSLLELFVNMDIARMSELNVDECMGAFDAVAWNMGVDRPGDISNGAHPRKLTIVHAVDPTTEFYNKVAWVIEHMLHMPLALDTDGPDWPR